MAKAKAKTSRKGKKQWRKNIKDDEIVEALEKKNAEERRVKLEELKDDQLFVEDKEATTPALGPRKKRIDKATARTKLTKAQLILQQGDSVRPVVAGSRRKQYNAHKAIHVLNAEKDRERTDEAAAATKKRGRASKAADESEALDIWGDAAPEATRRQGVAGPAHGDSTIAQGKRTRGPRRAPVRKAPIPAVEVAAPGTSYHPSFEDHQDAVAEAVAEEMRKELRQELGPNVSKDALERLKLSAAAGPDDMVVDLPDSDSESGSDSDGGEVGAAARRKRDEKKTKTERNRQARAKERRREEEERLALKKQRREIEKLAELEREIEEEEEEKQVLRERREAVRAERELTEPPKLGKNRFEDMPVQVMATDELTGSLRSIKPCAVVAKDRFKSIQKRGLVEVTKKQAKKKGRRILYESGARSDRAREEQAELWALQEKNRRMRRELELGELAKEQA